MRKIMRGFFSFCLIGLGMSFGSIYAESTSVEPKTQTTEVAPPPAAPSEGLLMTGLGSIGVGDLLKKAGINFFGYSEAGMMYDTTATRNGMGPTYLG